MSDRDARRDERAHVQAERWFVRLTDPSARAAERAAFERWRRADRLHAHAYQDVEELWARSREAAANAALRAVADRELLARAPGVPRRWALAAAVAALAVAVIVGAWWVLAAVPRATIYATAIGAQRTVALHDGTALLLDTDSAVAVRYGAHARRVDLLRGRVQFKVRHEATRPFVVQAGSGVLTDLGTEFQVSLNRAGAVHVVLLHGSVAVSVAGATTRLEPGQALRFNRHGFTAPAHAADLAAAIGWTQDNVIASDWTLPKLLAASNRYSTVKLVIGAPALRTDRISGVFREGDQATLVKVLEAGWPIRAERISASKIELVPAADVRDP